MHCKTARLQDCKAVSGKENYHIRSSVQNNNYSLDVSLLRRAITFFACCYRILNYFFLNMPVITRELLRKRAEHNECMISTLEEVNYRFT